jgi:hypothetical protein
MRISGLNSHVMTGIHIQLSRPGKINKRLAKLCNSGNPEGETAVTADSPSKVSL